MKILHIDNNHPTLIQGLRDLGWENVENFTDSKNQIEKVIHLFDGLVVRSRFPIDTSFLKKAKRLKFIARVGAGMENIDLDQARVQGIHLFSAPEGNATAVAEHALGMLLSLTNHIPRANQQVKSGIWLREQNRGNEISGKTVGIIGYGNMGKAFASVLSGLNVEVIFYDILDHIEDTNARQVSLKDLQNRTDILSLHTPETEKTIGMVNSAFINQFSKPFWLINTARGKAVVTEDLVEALKKRQIKGAALDVLDFEKSSFETLFQNNNLPEAFSYLTQSDRVILSPHIAGWTFESHQKLAQVLLFKIKAIFT